MIKCDFYKFCSRSIYPTTTQSHRREFCEGSPDDCQYLSFVRSSSTRIEAGKENSQLELFALELK